MLYRINACSPHVAESTQPFNDGWIKIGGGVRVSRNGWVGIPPGAGVGAGLVDLVGSQLKRMVLARIRAEVVGLHGSFGAHDPFHVRLEPCDQVSIQRYGSPLRALVISSDWYHSATIGAVWSTCPRRQPELLEGKSVEIGTCEQAIVRTRVWRSRRLQVQRHANDLLVERIAVPPETVLAESLAVVRGDDQYRVAQQRAILQRSQETGDLCVEVPQLAVVENRIEGAVVVEGIRRSFFTKGFVIRLGGK